MKRLYFKSILLLAGVFYQYSLFAQGQQGLQAATNELKGYYDDMSNLILAIGALVGLLGGIRCYTKWNTGDQDVMKSVMGWGGACVFLIIVGVVIKAFFVS